MIVSSENKPIDISAPQAWSSPLQEQRSCSSFDFDAIVVGSGLGGLACAALLAKHSIKVLVLEQHYQVGGYCSSFQRNGFTFTSGVEDISGVEAGDTAQLLAELDLKKEDLFVLNTRMFIIGDKRIRLDGTKQGTVSALSKAFPDEAEAIVRFIDEAEYVLRMEDPGNETVQSWVSITYQQKLDQYFRNPELKSFFCSLLVYIGMPADQVPAQAAIGPCLSYFIVGGYYPKGGPQNFVNSIRDYITAHSGKVLTNKHVDEIIVSDGIVGGVRVGDKTYSSPVVVSNVNAKTLYQRLIAPGRVHKVFVDAIGALPMSISCCMVQIGTDIDLSCLPSHIQVLDKGAHCHCVINSNADHSLAPEGKSSLTFICGGDYRKTPPRGTPEYARYKDERAKTIISRAEAGIPNLQDLQKHILALDISTPLTFERYTSMPEGAIYGFEQSIGLTRPNFKSPIRGLYLASSSTAGGGVESVIGAGLTCARDILGKNTAHSSSS